MPHPHYLDEELFAALRTAIDRVDDVEVIQAMTSVEKREFDRFLTNEVENPKFLIRQTEFDAAAATNVLGACVDLVEGSAADEVVVQLYRAKLKNQQLRFQLLDAVANVNDEWFCSTSKLIYGSPSREYFSQIVHYVLEQQPKTPVAEDAAVVLADTLNHVAKPKAVLPIDVLPPPEPTDETGLSSSAVRDIFMALIESLDLTGWEAVVDETGARSRFSVNPIRKLVHVPNDEQLAGRPQPMTQRATEALAAHEIGVHALRAHQGAQQPLKLLSLGLDGYLRGEEGLASYEQQQIEGARWFYGQDRYLAICLALGLDGEPRDFRSVFALMRAYYQLQNADQDPVSARTVRQAWEVTRRIFRGTSGQSTGQVYTRDLAYFEGNVGLWEFLINHPDRHPYLGIGKFDPLNKRHVTSLQTLNILPQW